MQARSTGLKGEALISFTMPAPELVRTNAIEYSADNGETWVNGTYTSVGKVKLTNLPPRVDLLLRVRSIGTRQRRSAWVTTMVAVI